MFPQLAECDFSGSSFVDTKDSANFAKRHAESIHVSDLVHLGFVEQNSWVSFSKKCSAFLLAIISVVLGRSKEKMVWPDAGREVALVANQQISGVNPIGKEVSESVSSKVTLFSAYVKRKSSIVEFDGYPGPQPAFSLGSMPRSFVDASRRFSK